MLLVFVSELGGLLQLCTVEPKSQMGLVELSAYITRQKQYPSMKTSYITPKGGETTHLAVTV